MSDLPPFHPRNAVRYRVKEGAVAIQGSKIGQIIDISLTGIAFQYIAMEEDHPHHTPLRIICNHDSFSLAEIPSHEVYDCALPENHSFSFLKMRRRGLAFREMIVDQNKALEYFIAHHTLGPI